jgi:hydroxymethylpyrimidine pyrophosphatase-like HAD family hydrolase
VNESSAPAEALPLDPAEPPDAPGVASPPRPIRLIALDVDGTLVNPAGHIAPRTALAIRAARARGVEVIIATGRSFSEGIQALSAELELAGDVPAIVRNGSAIQDVATGEVLIYRVLPAEAVRLALDAALAGGTMPMIAEGPRHGEYLYTLHEARDNASARAVIAGWNRADTTRYVTAAELYAVPEPTWLGGCGSLDATGRLYETLSAVQGAQAYWSATGLPEAVLAARRHFVAGISPAGVSKAVGLQIFAAERGISLEETMAVGDYFNDVEMLREVGWGVVMGHAPDGVKAVADAIVPDNGHDGAAIAIERYVLGLVGEGQ